MIGILQEIQAFKDQDFESLRAECNEDSLFEDPEFPASNKSLYFTQSPPNGIKWLRPKVNKKSYNYKVVSFSSIGDNQLKSNSLGSIRESFICG